MKSKRLFTFITAVIMILSICTTLPVKVSVPLKVNAATDVSNLYPVDSTYSLIKSLEGCDLNCFWDVAQWTIGYGNKCPYTHNSNGTYWHQPGGHSISESEARSLFSSKLSGYVNTLKSNCSGLSMTQNQFDALLSATYNHGNVKSCPLKYYLQGKLTETEAREQYYVWCINAGTKDEKGLRNRRKKEADVFFSDPDPNPPTDLSISADKEYYAVGEMVNFSFTYNNATELYIPLDYNGIRSDFIDVTGKSSYSCSFDKPGIYGFFLYGKNIFGESSTVDNYLQFEIYDNSPSELSIHTDKTLYEVGEKINFSFSSKNATELYIPIDYNGKRSDFIDVTGKNSYSCTFDKPGTYGFFLYGKNKFGETSTADEYLEFKILSNQKGDANNDGELKVSDAVLLKKWLLAESDTMLPNWKAADLYEDDRIDVFDMIEMRKLIIDSQSAQ